MKPSLPILLSAYMICHTTAALSAEYGYGPIGFTNESTITYPKFSPATGYLHSITFVLTNCVLQHDIVCDNDSTNDLILDVDVFGTISVNFATDPLWLERIYGVATVQTNLTGEFSATDDGDRIIPYTYDGGPDELYFTCAYSNVVGKRILTNADALSDHSSNGNKSIHIRKNTFGYSTRLDHTLDLFITNETYSGELYVYYDYEEMPLTPELTSIVVSNGEFQFDIQNISLGSSNRLQRSFNLLSTNWTDVAVFTATSWHTNWVDSVGNGTPAVFYRVLSK